MNRKTFCDLMKANKNVNLELGIQKFEITKRMQKIKEELDEIKAKIKKNDEYAKKLMITAFEEGLLKVRLGKFCRNTKQIKNFHFKYYDLRQITHRCYPNSSRLGYETY